ncbi:hypothetical protein [Rhodococcus sp. NPDC057529]|uniref:hypothetical protein n=1 Tax=Rhodococcus sp. NPDC057529 TaxID=3346158 RepID=UPI00366D5822
MSSLSDTFGNSMLPDRVGRLAGPWVRGELPHDIGNATATCAERAAVAVSAVDDMPYHLHRPGVTQDSRTSVIA